MTLATLAARAVRDRRYAIGPALRRAASRAP